MITWVRASLVHEGICVSIPRRHIRGIVRRLGVAPKRVRPMVPLSGSSLGQSPDHLHSTKHLSSGCCCGLVASVVRQAVYCESSWRGICVA